MMMIDYGDGDSDSDGAATAATATGTSAAYAATTGGGGGYDSYTDGDAVPFAYQAYVLPFLLL